MSMRQFLSIGALAFAFLAAPLSVPSVANADETTIQVDRDALGENKTVVIGNGDAGLRIQSRGSSKEQRAREALKIFQQNKMNVTDPNGNTVVTDGQGNIVVHDPSGATITIDGN